MPCSKNIQNQWNQMSERKEEKISQKSIIDQKKLKALNRSYHYYLALNQKIILSSCKGTFFFFKLPHPTPTKWRKLRNKNPFIYLNCVNIIRENGSGMK